MPFITIDDKQIAASDGATVFQAALENGIFIPHFCWHPLLSVAGNCRMCVVEVAGRSKPEISCNLPATEGMIVRTNTPVIKKARQDVLEFLLANHPLDCPICDQAGECFLQDYYFKYSGRRSRFAENKSRKPKAVDIGKHVKLDDERCILCGRCVRFCTEVARTGELTVAQRGDRSFVTTAPEKRLDNPYSMAAADICPVGALTPRDFRFKKRVWFLKSAPSVCHGCSNGCQTWIDHDGQAVYRLRPRAEGEQLSVPAFLCDDGKLSYKEWQLSTRIRTPLVKDGDGIEAVSEEEAIGKFMSVLDGEIVCVISSQCSCEEADALLTLGARFYQAGRVKEHAGEDDIIRKRDKNPNTAYLNALGLKRLPEKISGDVLIVADTFSAEDDLKINASSWKAVIQFTHDEALIVPSASVIFPRATVAETDGSFVNFEGKRREFRKALEPVGDERSISEWMKRIIS